MARPPNVRLSGTGQSRHVVPFTFLFRQVLVFTLFLLFTCAPLTHAGDQTLTPLELSNEQSRYPLGLHLGILEDPSTRLTLADILSPTQVHPFEPSREAVPSLGFTDSAYWYRVPLKNATAADGAWLLELKYPPLQHLEVYMVHSDGRVEEQVGGSLHPVSQRPLRYRAPVFTVELTAGEEAILYLRAVTESSMILPLTLWELEAFAEEAGDELYLQGIYYGLIGALVLYNLFIFLTVRERSYLYYVLFLGFFVAYQFSLHGFAQLHLWPEEWTWTNQPLVISQSLAIMFGLLFTLNFLEVRRNHPWVHRVGMLFLVLSFLVLALSVFGGYQAAIKFSTLLGGAVVLYSISAGTASVLKGYKPARYFLVAWLMLVIGTVLQTLRVHGVVGSNFVTEHSLQIGSALEAILLSLALAARIRNMKDEKEAAQQAIVDNMQRMDQVKDEFLANTSHELRTPINGISGLAEALLQNRGQSFTEEERQSLDMIVSSSRRLATLVNDILDFSRLRHEDLPLAQKPVDIKALTDVVLILLQPLCQDKDLVLHNAITEDIPPVFADENRLQQILHNLVGNAIKFTSQGRVEITAEHLGDKVAISVTDTGIGIPPDKIEGIFESFNQGDGSIAREYGGTGLGLSITRKMVELHGGEITVNSIPEAGSTFTFTLPVSHETAQNSEQTPSLSYPMAEEVPAAAPLPKDTSGILSNIGKRGRILVVDDEPINRQVLRSQLTGAGYSVAEAANGSQALDLLQKEASFDLILLDVMMPSLSGYDVCRKLRSRWSAEQLPVIFLTARTQSEDIVAAFQVGANDYLAKPFSRDELQARVALHLDLARNYQDLADRNRELQELTQANESLEEISITDALTGLKNRRYFDMRYEQEFVRALGTRQVMAVIMIDIDHFKSFNDNHGHSAGDKCLQAVAERLRNSVTRPYDAVCRYGGEEFIVLLPGTDEKGARAVAERIRRNVEALEFTVDGKTMRVTVSLGVAAHIPDPTNPPDHLVQKADENLYRAKEKGRNRVETATPQ